MTEVTRPNFDVYPVTFGAYCSEQMKHWDELFPAERSYFQRLSDLLTKAPAAFFDPLRAVETKMGVTANNWPKGQFTLAQVDFLNRNPHYPEWRSVITRMFAEIDPQLDAQLRRKAKPRLVIVYSPADMPVGPDRMWLRIKSGQRVGVKPPEDLTQSASLLLRGVANKSKPSLVDETAASFGDYAAWAVEAGNSFAGHASGPKALHLAYEDLATYRQRLMTEVQRITESEKIQGPRQLGERLKTLKMAASESTLANDPVMSEFLRATLLNGNGTLLINNTFVEWASVQAVRRARPTLLCVGFGIRNKIKPFSSLLIYSDQDRSSPVPTQADMLGSYVDLEMLYEYVWREPLKYPEYQNNTVFFFLAEGMDEGLLIAPPDFEKPAEPLPLDAWHTRFRNWLAL
jgi:hypothetical protein